MSGAPYNAHVGGVSPAFIAVEPSAAADSWLTVGITDGDTDGALSQIGIDFDSWTATMGLVSTDGAVFFMNPDGGPSGVVTVAQLTVPIGSSGVATMGMQGQSTSGAGNPWVKNGVTFRFGPAPSALPYTSGGAVSPWGRGSVSPSVSALSASLAGYTTYRLNVGPLRRRNEHLLHLWDRRCSDDAPRSVPSCGCVWRQHRRH